MPVLEHGRLRADDWTLVADDAPIPDGPAILSPARLRTLADDGRNAPLGLALPPDADPDSVADLLPRVALVALTFPKFRDGRAFTQARALREHHRFAGEIRATGHVLPDQYAMWLRCGGSSVAVKDGADPAVWARSRDALSIAYQTAQDTGQDSAPGLGLRRHRMKVA